MTNTTQTIAVNKQILTLHDQINHLDETLQTATLDTIGGAEQLLQGHNTQLSELRNSILKTDSVAQGYFNSQVDSLATKNQDLIERCQLLKKDLELNKSFDEFSKELLELKNKVNSLLSRRDETLAIDPAIKEIIEGLKNRLSQFSQHKLPLIDRHLSYKVLSEEFQHLNVSIVQLEEKAKRAATLTTANQSLATSSLETFYHLLQAAKETISPRTQKNLVHAFEKLPLTLQQAFLKKSGSEHVISTSSLETHFKGLTQTLLEINPSLKDLIAHLSVSSIQTTEDLESLLSQLQWMLHKEQIKASSETALEKMDICWINLLALKEICVAQKRSIAQTVAFFVSKKSQFEEAALSELASQTPATIVPKISCSAESEKNPYLLLQYLNSQREGKGSPLQQTYSEILAAAASAATEEEAKKTTNQILSSVSPELLSLSMRKFLTYLRTDGKILTINKVGEKNTFSIISAVC